MLIKCDCPWAVFSQITHGYSEFESTLYIFFGGGGCSQWHVSIALAVIAAFPGSWELQCAYFLRTRECTNSQLQPEEEVTNLQWAKKDVHLVLTKRICTAESICNTIIQASCLVNNWAKSTNSMQHISGKNVYTNMSLIQTCKDNFHFCCILSVLYFEACPWSLHFNAASMQQQYTQIFELIGEKQNMFGLLSVMQFHSF